MRFKCEIDGRSLRLLADQPDRWDGTPLVDCFVIDHIPGSLSADRLAVAFTLLFGECLGGRAVFPNEINVITANAIREFLSPVEVHFEGVNDAPAKIVFGEVECILNNSAVILGADAVSQDHRMLSLLNRGEHLGAVFSARGLTVSSNALLFNRFDSVPAGDVAAAVLLSEEFNAGTVRLRGVFHATQFQRYYELLNSVGLKLMKYEPSLELSE